MVNFLIYQFACKVMNLSVLLRKSVYFWVMGQHIGQTEAFTIGIGTRLGAQYLVKCMLVPRIINSMSTDHKPVNSGCCRWIFSTINGREFCKAGKVVEPHFTLVNYIHLYIQTRKRARVHIHTWMVILFYWSFMLSSYTFGFHPLYPS